MDILQALILALIQGVTEFLPISSSAHLLLPSIMLGWADQGLVFDTTVHLGSLTAVIAYFRQDLRQLVAAALPSSRLTGHSLGEEALGEEAPSEDGDAASNLLLCLVIASVPVLVAGFLARGLVETVLRDPSVIAWVIACATIGFGILLGLADLRGRVGKPAERITPASALAIGLAQCLALIPGTSRSGVTMTMALLAGFSRQAAARISFLISIPAIAGASLVKLYDLFAGDALADAGAAAPTTMMGTMLDTTMGTTIMQLSVGFAVAALAAWFSIKLFLEFISRISFLPFVIYRLLLGSLLIFFIL